MLQRKMMKGALVSVDNVLPAWWKWSIKITEAEEEERKCVCDIKKRSDHIKSFMEHAYSDDI